MDELLKLTIENNMSIYKVAYNEGYKRGYAEGLRDSWKKANEEIDKITEQMKKIIS